MADKHLSLSIMFPFLNDWGTVGSLVALAVQTAKKYTDDWEVVIVDDGSTKENSEALEMIVDMINPKSEIRNPKQISNAKIQKNLQRIKIIHHEKNTGYGGALRSGFSHCSKDFIFYTDCDAQYDPREMSLLIEAFLRSSSVTPLASGEATADTVGMVNGYKIKRHDPWYRIIAGRLYHYIVKISFRLPIGDTDCDFRLIRRKSLERVTLFESTGTICVELVKKMDHAGYSILEVPVHHYWRTSGKSQFFNFMRLYRTATNLLKLWWKLMIMNRYT